MMCCPSFCVFFLQHLRTYLQEEHLDKKKAPLDLSEWKNYTPKDIPMQMNGFDCGMFMCKFLDCAARDEPFDFSQVSCSLFVSLFLWHTGSLSPSFSLFLSRWLILA